MRGQYKQPVIRDLGWKFKFGRHAGETLQEVLDEDPQYIVWMAQAEGIDFHWTIIEMAEKGDAELQAENRLKGEIIICEEWKLTG